MPGVPCGFFLRLGPTWAWNLLLSSFSPASYLGLSLQPCFLGLLNSFKFCTSLCNAGSSMKTLLPPFHLPWPLTVEDTTSRKPSCIPGVVSWRCLQLGTHSCLWQWCFPPRLLFAFCSVYVSAWSVEFSSWPPPKEGTLLPDGDTEVSLLPA